MGIFFRGGRGMMTSIIAAAEHNFEHDSLLLEVTPNSITLNFRSINVSTSSVLAIVDRYCRTAASLASFKLAICRIDFQVD